MMMMMMRMVVCALYSIVDLFIISMVHVSFELVLHFVNFNLLKYIWSFRLFIGVVSRQRSLIMNGSLDLKKDHFFFDTIFV